MAVQKLKKKQVSPNTAPHNHTQSTFTTEPIYIPHRTASTISHTGEHGINVMKDKKKCLWEIWPEESSWKVIAVVKKETRTADYGFTGFSVQTRRFCFAGRCCVTFCNVGGPWKMSPLLKSQNLQSSCAARAWSLNNTINTQQVPYTNGNWNCHTRHLESKE